MLRSETSGFCFCFDLIWFRATPSSTQGFLLALYSGITTSRAQKIISDAEDRTQVSNKVRTVPVVQSLQAQDLM